MAQASIKSINTTTLESKPRSRSFWGDALAYMRRDRLAMLGDDAPSEISIWALVVALHRDLLRHIKHDGDRFGAKKLWRKVQRSSHEAQAIQHHRLHGLTDTDGASGIRHAGVDLIDEVNFLTDPCDDAQVV